MAAAVLFLAVAVGVIVLTTSVNSGERKDTQGQLQEDGGAKPHIIPLPNSGTPPKNPGDRGGWEQFLVMGLIVAGLGVIGVLALRGNRTARANRAAWRAAAQVPEEASTAAGPSDAAATRAPPPGTDPPSDTDPAPDGDPSGATPR